MASSGLTRPTSRDAGVLRELGGEIAAFCGSFVGQCWGPAIGSIGSLTTVVGFVGAGPYPKALEGLGSIRHRRRCFLDVEARVQKASKEGDAVRGACPRRHFQADMAKLTDADSVGVSAISLVESVYFKETRRLPAGIFAGSANAVAASTGPLVAIPIDVSIPQTLTRVSRESICLIGSSQRRRFIDRSRCPDPSVQHNDERDQSFHIEYGEFGVRSTMMNEFWRAAARCSAAACIMVLTGCSGAASQNNREDGSVVDAATLDGLVEVDAETARDVQPDRSTTTDASVADSTVADANDAFNDGASVDRGGEPSDGNADGGLIANACPSAAAGVPDSGTLVGDSPEKLRAAIIGRWLLCDGYGFSVPSADYRQVISIEADGTFAFWKKVAGTFVRGVDIYDKGGTWLLGTGPELGDIVFRFADGNGGSIRPTFQQDRRWLYAYGVFASDSYFVPDPSWP